MTADCPLCDPRLIDKTIELYNKSKVDYASNTIPPDIKKYPDGCDVEVFSFESLKLAWNKSKDPQEREHVTFYFWKSKNNFSTALLENENDWGKYRITVDYKEDMVALKEIVKNLRTKNEFGYIEVIVQIIQQNPEI